MRVNIFDVDAGNPYGRELALLLAEKFDVRAIIPVDTQWTPQGIEVRKILPANGPAHLAKQGFLQARALVSVANEAFLRGASIIVVMTRGWYDDLALAMLAMAGARIIVIAHDPVPKRPLSRLRAFCQRLLWRHARRLVSHSAELAAQAGDASGRRADAVPHLPFAGYAAWSRAAAPDEKSQNRQCRLLVLGHIREDKGLDRLPFILGSLSPDMRAQLTIAFAGRGDLQSIGDVDRMIRITRRPGRELLSDLEIAQELSRSDVLIAPYPLVSASGSVVLALSRGLRVVAYDTGSLADVVSPTGLVSCGDENGFGDCIAAAIDTPRGGPARPIHEWSHISLQAWSRLITERN